MIVFFLKSSKLQSLGVLSQGWFQPETGGLIWAKRIKLWFFLAFKKAVYWGLCVFFELWYSLSPGETVHFAGRVPFSRTAVSSNAGSSRQVRQQALGFQAFPYFLADSLQHWRQYYTIPNWIPYKNLSNPPPPLVPQSIFFFLDLCMQTWVFSKKRSNFKHRKFTTKFSNPTAHTHGLHPWKKKSPKESGVVILIGLGLGFLFKVSLGEARSSSGFVKQGISNQPFFEKTSGWKVEKLTQPHGKSEIPWKFLEILQKKTHTFFV